MDMESVRAERGRRIAACGGVKATGTGVWTVDSQSKSGARYTVRLDPGGASCTCPDYQEVPKQCKHIHAVLATTTAADAAPPLPTGSAAASTAHPRRDGNDTTRSLKDRPTYPQQWSAYNQAQTHEAEMFMGLVQELCEGIVQPPQTLGRRRLLLSDVIMVALLKIYTMLSGRRLASAVRDLAARGVIERVIHYNSLFRHLANPDLTPVLMALLEQSAAPMKPLERSFAADSTSFGTSVYDHWFEDRPKGKSKKPEGVKSEAEWCKAHVLAGTQSHVVVSAVVDHRGSSPDSPQLLPMAASAVTPGFVMDEVAADKAYLSKENVHGLAALGAAPFIPFKVNSNPGKTASCLWRRLHGLFLLEQDKFLAHYHKRSNVETTFSMVKLKFGHSVRSKLPVTQVNEIILKLVAHNVCCVVKAVFEVGLEPNLRGAGPTTRASVASDLSGKEGQ